MQDRRSYLRLQNVVPFDYILIKMTGNNIFLKMYLLPQNSVTFWTRWVFSTTIKTKQIFLLLNF